MLLLSDKWLGNDENGDILNFDCILKTRAGGIAYLRNFNNSLVCTSNVNIKLRQANMVSVCSVSRKDLCRSV